MLKVRSICVLFELSLAASSLIAATAGGTSIPFCWSGVGGVVAMFSSVVVRYMGDSRNRDPSVYVSRGIRLKEALLRPSGRQAHRDE